MNLCKISSCHKSICRACFVIRAEKLFGFLFKKLWRSKIVFGRRLRVGVNYSSCWRLQKNGGVFLRVRIHSSACVFFENIFQNFFQKVFRTPFWKTRKRLSLNPTSEFQKCFLTFFVLALMKFIFQKIFRRSILWTKTSEKPSENTSEKLIFMK